LAESELERFLEACDSAGPLQLGLAGPGRPGEELRRFLQPFVVIGKFEGADLHLDHPDISRRHAYLQMIAGRLYCIDLASRSGTFWESGPGRYGWLDPGQSIGIGPFRIRPWERGGRGEEVVPFKVDSAIPPTSSKFEQTSLPEVTLEFGNERSAPREWRFDRSLVLLGRSPVCKLRLPDPDGSKVYCSLVRTTAGVWVVDLLGSPGTILNGARVRCRKLEDGDELLLGRRHIRLRIGEPVARLGGFAPLSIAPADPVEPDHEHPAITPSSSSSWELPETVTERALATERTLLSDPLLAPLIQEFGNIQQQMADQFQQALMMMFRLFNGMHQEQMALIREELAQLHRLTEEHRALQLKLEYRPPSPEPEVRSKPRRESETSKVARPRPSPALPQEAVRDEGAPSVSPGAASQPQSSFPREGAEDIHAKLFERLAAIQSEREGRWQRLLNSVMGKGSD
jgi:pSer/pThr/pTyr-binding forkhead associated (FHA) protein